MSVRQLALFVVAIGALALAGCTPPDAAPSIPPTGIHSPSASATASPSTDPQKAAVTIPTDCRKVVSADVYAATFGDTPLNDPAVVGDVPVGAVTPSPPPAGANTSEILSSATQLHCIWKDPRADISYLELTVGTVDDAMARAYLDGLPAQGYTCTDANGGRHCQLVKPNDQYPVDEAHTDFLRDEIFVVVNQINFPTKNLLGAVVHTLWD